jgi:hypothetical protein
VLPFFVGGASVPAIGFNESVYSMMAKFVNIGYKRANKLIYGR